MAIAANLQKILFRSFEIRARSIANMGTRLPIPLVSAKLRPIEFHEARLSRGSSLFLIAVLSALCWVVLISGVLLVWGVL